MLDDSWSTDRITPEGREKLRAAGFAPPAPRAASAPTLVQLQSNGFRCPYCGSTRHRGSRTSSARRRAARCATAAAAASRSSSSRRSDDARGQRRPALHPRALRAGRGRLLGLERARRPVALGARGRGAAGRRASLGQHDRAQGEAAGRRSVAAGGRASPPQGSQAPRACASSPASPVACAAAQPGPGAGALRIFPDRCGTTSRSPQYRHFPCCPARYHRHPHGPAAGAIEVNPTIVRVRRRRHPRRLDLRHIRRQRVRLHVQNRRRANPNLIPSDSTRGLDPTVRLFNRVPDRDPASNR